ncbi:MAG: MBL fold metallo-hydrolase [Nitrospinaceae bacterium]|nr:MBL fold metallo-hydrolase [Nitrospinaceae bacterium]NIR57335.1 MBL fold metallo-hydrolase [Nitrospinaceae bacterium]NIS87787.1 MBL fold metallo-hydrolase [Nitrospinaceae bacterium]NIT84657.1 MBL fold metallo-hydrolase [Nitrospinaceae bacterium]NIU46836.1 MBL fold metallo-hydrolase [Nitrospinaceae bacterium]
MSGWRFLILGFLTVWWAAGCMTEPAVPPPGFAPSPKKAAETPPGWVPDGYVEAIPRMPEKGYLLKPLAPEVYFFSNGVYNTLFVVTEEGVILIDPIQGAGHLLRRAVREVTEQPVIMMIYSHPHRDHIGDASMFAEGIKIVAHRETQKLLQRYNDPARPVPNIAFGEKYAVELGGLRLDLIYPGDGHGKGNIIIHIPQRRLLMFVDVATPKSVPFKNFTTVDIFSQIAGLKRALQLDFDTYVAGHLYRPGKRAEMEEVLQYYFASKRANAEALKRVSIGKIMRESRSKDIERKMGEYYEAVAEECYRILKPKWKPRLMGFEAFARGHCDVWTAFHRTHQSPGNAR